MTLARGVVVSGLTKRRLSMTKMISLILLAASLKVQAQSVIKIDGSSTVFPITEAVSEEFQKIDKRL